MPKANKYSRRSYKRGGVKGRVTDANLFGKPIPIPSIPEGIKVKPTKVDTLDFPGPVNTTFDEAEELRKMRQADREGQQLLLDQLAKDYSRPMPPFGSEDDEKCVGVSCAISGGRKTRSRRGRKSRKPRKYRRSRRH